MTEYVVLLPGNEAAWEAATEQERAEMYAQHGEFARLLAERGHRVTGGNELTHSREARVVRRNGAGVTVTDGPYAETTEQLTGFYVDRHRRPRRPARGGGRARRRRGRDRGARHGRPLRRVRVRAALPMPVR